MRSIVGVLTLVVIGALCAAPAEAQSQGIRGSWSLSLKGGIAGALSGDVHDAGSGTVLDLPTSVESRSYNDVYDLGYGFRAGLGYGVARQIELFGDFSWTRSTASPLSVGNVAGLDLQARFANYRAWGVEGGMRYHFAPDAGINPYMALVGGFRRVAAIPATFSVPAAGVVLTDTPFYDASVVPSGGADLGVLVEVAPRVAVGVEAGLRYHGSLDGLPGLAGTGLENLNDVGSRWSFPVVGSLMLRF